MAQMQRDIDAVTLGGTLYIPAIHKNLMPVCTQNRYPTLRSIIVCTEDSILESDLPNAFDAIRRLLETISGEQELKIFLRPRNLAVLNEMLALPHIETVDGFVLPKFDTGNMNDYLSLLEPVAASFYILPVIESADMFDMTKLVRIRDTLMASRLNVLTMRVGGEDMLKHFGLKRRCEESLYDLVAPASVIGDIIKVFKPYGFNIAAPVYNCIHATESYRAEVEADLRQGLIGKTIIHPGQIDPINDAYHVTSQELEMARAMVAKETPAIIVKDGVMGEKFAHTSWAETILKRAEYYGVKK
jgi:citrate lyase beta subunit